MYRGKDLFIYVMYTYCCYICKTTLNTSSYRLSKKPYPVCYDCQESGYREKAQAKPTKKSRRSSLKQHYTFQDYQGNIKVRTYVDDYEKQVWILTENQPLNTLPGYSLRGRNGHHLDHIVPISYGKSKNIPPIYIASLDNLRFIPSKDNLRKGANLTQEGIELLKECNYYELS